MGGKMKITNINRKMTPEQIETILESNSRAIASNSDAVAELKRQTQAQIAESQRQPIALYQLSAELVRDRSTMIEIIRGLNEDRVTNSENIATIAENISTISNTLIDIAKSLETRSE